MLSGLLARLPKRLELTLICGLARSGIISETTALLSAVAKGSHSSPPAILFSMIPYFLREVPAHIPHVEPQNIIFHNAAPANQVFSSGLMIKIRVIPFPSTTTGLKRVISQATGKF
jgi:hypothetical protein